MTEQRTAGEVVEQAFEGTDDPVLAAIRGLRALAEHVDGREPADAVAAPASGMTLSLSAAQRTGLILALNQCLRLIDGVSDALQPPLLNDLARTVGCDEVEANHLLRSVRRALIAVGEAAAND